MPSPARKFRNSQRDEAASALSFRDLSLRSSSLNIEERTVEADISTETPVNMPDWTRMEMIPEVLVASGAQIPKSRQVPFLDSHNRASVSDQLGSAREITIANDKLTARLHFSEAAGNEWTKVREGHVTDVSVGYEVLKRSFVPSGETKNIGGRAYAGPVNVVTKWRLREVSLTPIGADAQAKLRGLDPTAISFQSEKGQFSMNEELRKLLVSRGMDASLSDDEAQRWLLANPEKLATPEAKQRGEQKDAPSVETRSLTADDIARLISEGTRQALELSHAKRSTFVKLADTLCDLADLPDLKAQARELSDEDSVRSFLLAEKKKRSEDLHSGPSVRITGDGFAKLRSDIGEAVTLKALRNINAKPESIENALPTDQRSKTAGQWRNASIFEMAREVVQASGVDVRGLTREEIAQCALFGADRIGVRSGGAYHTTGSFTAITLDAVNKAAGIGYTEAPSTWRGPMRQGSSVADFKNKHTIRLGAVPNLPVWNDNTNPEKASVADAKVTYAVEARSLEIDFSYRLLVNDDMDMLSRIPAQMGSAAARTVNAVAWSQITANPTMAYDSVALFAAATGNRKRTNLTTGAGAPSVSTLQTLTNLMQQMRGENTPEQNESADILNLTPRFIVGGSALSTTIKQLVLSAYDPSSANMAYNTATGLIPVIEPLLDANSTTAWYLFADPSQIDTVEVSFLQGQESPVVRSFMDERKMSQSFIILQSFAAAPINHRGIQKHAGA
jgi:hypothetical protein